MMPKTLVVSWMVPPAMGGSAVIMANLASQFGRDEMYLLGERVAGGQPWENAPGLPKVEHVELTQTTGGRLTRRLKELLHIFKVRLALRRVMALIREENVRVILAVYPRWEYLLLARLAARQSGLPLVLYFHNTYLENVRAEERLLARWIQPKVFQEARHVFVMSEGMVEYYRQAYPGLSVSALLHTFTEPLPAFVPPPEPAPRLRLAFSGCITDSCLDALSRIIMAVRDLEWVDFTFHTPTSPSVFRGLSPLPRHWQFTPLSRERLLAALRQADVLILPHGFEGSFAPIEYETIFPTKTIEYLISGRPILAHSPPNCFLTRFLKEHACALLVEEKSVPALKEALLRLRGDGQLRSQLVRAGLKTAEMFQAGRVADRLRHTIADTISNGRGQ